MECKKPRVATFSRFTIPLLSEGVANVHRRRAADAADAATAAPDVRAHATKPRKDRAVHVGQRPQPATQGQARPGPQRTAMMADTALAEALQHGLRVEAWS